MARKETITRDIILTEAFQIAKQEGCEQVTARKLAAQIGCSTQPIFRVYHGMQELEQALYEKAMDYYEEYYQHYMKMQPFPFIDLGMAYIKFAKNEKNIFQLLFLSQYRGEKSMYELLNGRHSNVGKEITKAKIAGCQEPSELFMKMWIFIHGAACMTITGDFDLSEEETLQLLKDSYRAYAGI